MGRVVIGMDPHKRSATIEVVDERERVLQVGRFETDRDGYRDMLSAGRRWPDRVWAVEGCNGVGRHLAQRLVADGEPVVDVPAMDGAAGTAVVSLERLLFGKTRTSSRQNERTRSAKRDYHNRRDPTGT